MALLLSTQAGSKPLIGAALMHRGKARAHFGEVDQARDDLQRSEAILQDVDWSIVRAWRRSATGSLELSVGDPAAAVRAYEPLLTVLETSGVREPFSAYFVSDAVEALVALGQLDRARHLLDDYLAAALGTGDMSKAFSLSAGWIINAAVAEWAIRRRIRPHPRPAQTATAPSP